MIVIAVSGWKGSGKDTMANYLVNEYGYKRLAFADVLKEMVAMQYNIPLNSLHEPELKEMPLLQYPVLGKDNFSKMIHNFMVKEFRTKDGLIPTQMTADGMQGMVVTEFGDVDYQDVFWTPRALAILEGSIKRSVNSGYWVQRVVDIIESRFKDNPYEKFVISDLRYRSEVTQLDDAFDGNLVTCRVHRTSDSPSDDPSERDLDNYDLDYNLDNKQDLMSFYSMIDDVVTIAEGSIL